MHSADWGMDHALVRNKLLVAPRKFFRNSLKCSPSINTARMTNDSNTSLFKSLLSVKAMPDYLGTNVEDTWSKFRSLVMGSAVSAFGLRQRKQPNWFRESANVLIPAVEERRKVRLHLKTRNTRAAKARLLTAKANVQPLVRGFLRDFWTKVSTEVQRCSEVDDLRGVCNGIDSAIEPHPVRTASLLSAQCALIQDPPLQLDRWVEHYSSIYSQEEHFTIDALFHLPQLPILHNLDAEISFSSVKQVVRSPGADGITAEILRCGVDILAAHLYNLLLLCWRSQCILQDLKNAITVTLCKNKGSRQDCNNYRGIVLLSVVGKVLALVILPRLQVLADLLSFPRTSVVFDPIVQPLT